MALYAFDGTWNKDKSGTENDTNVLCFSRGYQGSLFYLKGVGTRYGALGKVVGGIGGAGGRSRVKKARKGLAANFAKGDAEIDIVGFSRGAALALHFANKIEAKGVETANGTVFPRIRFLGLWDTVPSFGAPSVPANIGWDLDLPDIVDNCYHALALDERRHTSKLHRLEARIDDVSGERRLDEVWFRGVHSDVGGGNKNPGLASLALHWMFTKARQRGLPIDPKVVAENKRRFQPEARISVHEKDLIEQKFRIIRSNDETHSSVTFRNDTRARGHNNPPAGLSVVSDTGRRLRGFRRA